MVFVSILTCKNELNLQLQKWHPSVELHREYSCKAHPISAVRHQQQQNLEDSMGLVVFQPTKERWGWSIYANGPCCSMHPILWRAIESSILFISNGFIIVWQGAPVKFHTWTIIRFHNIFSTQLWGRLLRDHLGTRMMWGRAMSEWGQQTTIKMLWVQRQ